MDEEFVQLTKLVQDQRNKILPALEKCFRQVEIISNEAQQYNGNSARMKHMFTSRMLTMYSQLNNILYCFEKMVEDDVGLAAPGEVLPDVLQLDNNPDVAEEFSVGIIQQPADLDSSDDSLPQYQSDLNADQLKIEDASKLSTTDGAPVTCPSATGNELLDVSKDTEDSDVTSDDGQPSTSYSRLEEEEDDEDFELIQVTSRDTVLSNDGDDEAASCLLDSESKASSSPKKPVKIVTFDDCLGQDPEAVIQPTTPKYSAIDKMQEYKDKAVLKDKEKEVPKTPPAKYNFEPEPTGTLPYASSSPSPSNKKKKEEKPKKFG